MVLIDRSSVDGAPFLRGTVALELCLHAVATRVKGADMLQGFDA